MFRRLGFFLSILLFAIIEFYCFTAINLALRTVSPRTRHIVLSIYIFITIAAWAIVVSFRRLHYETWHPVLKTFVIAFVMGFFVAKVVMAIFIFVDDIRRFLTWIFRKANSYFPQAAKVSTSFRDISRSQFIARSAIIIGGLFFGGFLYGTRNKYRYVLKRVQLRFNNLPPAFKGLKIVQISDIHAGSFDDPEAVKRGIDMIMEQQPDMILITGDVVNNKASELEPYMEIFSELKAPMGVFSVLGNHDYGDYVEWQSKEDKLENLNTLKRFQREMGWQLLNNEHVVLERSGQKMALIGVENWSANLRFPRHGNLKQAYAGLEAEDIPFKMLMSHDPSHWDEEVNTVFKDIDLTFSGHTHGMQFGLRLPYFQWSPIQYIYHRWAGLYQKNEQFLYVNVGYGFLGYSGRLGILPEITVMELNP